MCQSFALINCQHHYRMRIGDYRVVYTVIAGNIVVIDTLLAGPRGDIYIKMYGLNQFIRSSDSEKLSMYSSAKAGT